MNYLAHGRGFSRRSSLFSRGTAVPAWLNVIDRGLRSARSMRPRSPLPPTKRSPHRPRHHAAISRTTTGSIKLGLRGTESSSSPGGCGDVLNPLTKAFPPELLGHNRRRAAFSTALCCRICSRPARMLLCRLFAIDAGILKRRPISMATRQSFFVLRVSSPFLAETVLVYDFFLYSGIPKLRTRESRLPRRVQLPPLAFDFADLLRSDAGDVRRQMKRTLNHLSHSNSQGTLA